MAGLLLTGALLALAGAAKSVIGRRHRAAVDHLALLHSQATPIRDVMVGRPVKLVGRVRPLGTPLRAPMSARACVGYEVELRKRDDAWQNHVLELRGIDFFIEDPSGVALVRVELGLLALAEMGPGRVSGRAPFAEARALLERHGRLGQASALGPLDELYFVERVLVTGRQVAVVGTCRWEPDPDPARAEGYRTTAECLVLRAQGRGTLIISDDPAVLG